LGCDHVRGGHRGADVGYGPGGVTHEVSVAEFFPCDAVEPLRATDGFVEQFGG
jgi:hypothetical protein